MEGRVRRIEGVSGIVQRLSIAWIGHSTVLLEAGGVRLLTDPVLRPRMAHVRRVAAPAERITGEVDAILISHVHHDHLDLRSLRLVGSRRLVVPRGAGRMLARRGYRNTVELGEGEAVSVGPLTVVATHAEHPSRRMPFGAETPALGFLIEGVGRTYFAGDTDLFDGMRNLGDGLDVALLPIGGWGPRLGPGHLDPRRAAESLRLLRPRVAVPIHWGTYRRIGLPRDEATLREPADRFARLAAELAPDVEVRVVEPGGRLEVRPAAVPAGAGP